jgi:hypothetical protein
LEKSLQPHSVFGTATAINCVGFYFMQNTYTTQTTVDKNICTIAVYMNHKWWHDYEFHTDDLYMIKGRNIIIDISCKNWGTLENIQEIHNSILKHLLSK